MSTSHRLHNSVYAALDAVANAEKITRVKLRELSRDLLIYVPETHDIEVVNRLMGVLTPMNRRVAVLYFSHFLPWSVENDADGNFNRFGKMLQGDKKVNKKLDAIKEWLAEEGNDIWTWSDENIEVKQKDFRATVSRAIKKALEGDEKSNTPALTREQLMDAIFEGGVSIEDMFAGIEAQEARIANDAQAVASVSDDNAPEEDKIAA